MKTASVKPLISIQQVTILTRMMITMVDRKSTRLNSSHVSISPLSLHDALPILDVDLENDDGESVGTVTLEEESEGVEVTLEGENLPKGMHAFHIHENGQCEAPDFDSAGDHFNPDDDNHG